MAQKDERIANERMATHWIDRYAAKIDSDFISPTLTHDRQRALHSASKEAESRTEDFVRVMRDYQGLLDLPVDFDISSASSWDEVLEIARRAEEKYDSDAGPVRKFVRGVGDYATGIGPWVTLLPNDSYMSVASGSLKVMLAAAARRSEQREKILLAVRTVPETLSQLQECREQFHSDYQLRELALKVYFSLLDMIEGLINSLVSESVWNKSKYAIIGDRKRSVRRYSKPSVDERITRCEGRVRDFNSRVKALTRTKIIETATTVTRLTSVVKGTRSDLERIEPSVVHTEALSKEIHSRAMSIHDQSSEMTVQIQDLGSGIEEIKATQSSMMITQEELLANFKDMLKDVLANNEWMTGEAERLRVQNRALGLTLVRSLTQSDTNHAADKEWLLKVLAVDPTCSTTEAQSMLQRGLALDSASSSCVLELFRHRRFREWLISGNADAVIVEGCSEEHALSRCSPMTLACALLTETLSQQPQAGVIQFFCGAHNTPSANTLTGGHGLIRSLLSQLLCLQDYDLGFMKSQQWHDRIERHDLEQLCELFCILSYQFRGSVLFCIIDGISLFEAQRWRDDARYVIGVLQHVIQKSEFGSKFKLLATSPGTSKYIKPLFDASGPIKLRGVLEDFDGVAARRALQTLTLENSIG